MKWIKKWQLLLNNDRNLVKPIKIIIYIKRNIKKTTETPIKLQG